MTLIPVSIVRWVDNHNPGIVECHLTDASGRRWSIIDKLPLFSTDYNLDGNSEYPQPGTLACEVLKEKVDDRGQKVALVDITTPWGLASTDGTTQFQVLQESLKTI